METTQAKDRLRDRGRKTDRESFPERRPGVGSRGVEMSGAKGQTESSQEGAPLKVNFSLCDFQDYEVLLSIRIHFLNK